MVKKSASYNVEEEIIKEFNKKAKEKSLNKSQWIENKMLEFIKEGDSNKQ